MTAERCSQRSIPLAIVGCGGLGTLVGEGVRDGKAGPYRVVAVFDAVRDRARALGARVGAQVCEDIDGLLDHRPAYVVEAAGGSALKQVGVRCLERGADLVCLSAGALADEPFMTELMGAALRFGRKVHVAAGALGGVDLAQAAVLAGGLEVTVLIEKPPWGLEGAPGLLGRTLPREERVEVFQGNAREAILSFPQNVNVTTTLALATLGLGSVSVQVCSDPGLSNNRHTVRLAGEFGRATVVVEAAPCPANPRSSLLAG